MCSVKFGRNFLAACLLEAVEYADYKSTELLIRTYNADCNFIIFGRGIAAIHYASGMEDAVFGEKAVRLMLDFGNGDPNVPTLDNETPLHVASIGGRGKIVQMLLEKGGDLEFKDNEHKTPVQYAFYEKHFDLIQLFQNFIFEKKLKKQQENKRLQFMNGKHLLAHINSDDCNKYTPNGKHYTYDVTSPYYINITHRKRKIPKEPAKPKDEFQEDENHVNEIVEESKNLFQLNERNLNEFEECTPRGKSRNSLIESWRSKIKTRTRLSYLKNLNELESLGQFSAGLVENELSDGIPLSSTINTEFKQNTLPEIIVTEGDNIHNSLLSDEENKSNNESFKTAQNDQPFCIRSPKLTDEFLCHMTEQYIHTDNEEGVVLYETRIPAEPLGFDEKTRTLKSDSITSTERHLPLDYDTETLRQELSQFGGIPGPITKSTKRLYMKKLVRFKRQSQRNNNSNNQQRTPDRKYSVELEKTLRENTWQDTIKNYIHLESKMTEQFQSSHERKLNLREGHLKTSFIYLLVDPRVSENLPGEATLLSPLNSWKKFLSSLFYIGKGKCSRPYSHLYDAIKIYNISAETKKDGTEVVAKGQVNRKLYESPRTATTENKKLNRIVDIWKSDKGVVCLHVFHNIMPAEAYTREAAIIDAIGLINLTNLKRGDYYGPSKSWDMRKRKQLGAFLLYKAFQIFLAEGESQLRPCDIK